MALHRAREIHGVRPGPGCGPVVVLEDPVGRIRFRVLERRGRKPGGLALEQIEGKLAVQGDLRHDREGDPADRRVADHVARISVCPVVVSPERHRAADAVADLEPHVCPVKRRVRVGDGESVGVGAIVVRHRIFGVAVDGRVIAAATPPVVVRGLDRQRVLRVAVQSTGTAAAAGGGTGIGVAGGAGAPLR